MSLEKNLDIGRGETFPLVVRWESAPIVYQAITAISLAAGAPRLTVPAHGMPDGWRCAVTRVKGMLPINAKSNPPKDKDYVPGTVISADVIELNTVAAYTDNGTEWPAYVAGGFLQYNTPHELTDYTALFEIKDKFGGTVLVSLTTANGGIVIDDEAKTITVTMTAETIETLNWKTAVYHLDLTSPDGVVTELLRGRLVNTKD